MSSIRRLGDCITMIIDYRGKTPKKLGSDWKDKGIRVISANNVHDGMLTSEDEIRCVDEETYNKWMKEPVKRGDCFLASEGATLGESLYWDSDEKVVLGQRLYAIRTNQDILDSKYFAMYLRSNTCRNAISSISTGSTVFGVSRKDLLNLEIILPDIDIQRKIGQIKYEIDKKILSNNKINAELEAMAKTIYDYWFLQFDFPDENGKPYKSSGGKMVWNEELKREIPEGWEVKRLGEIFNFIKGKIPDELSNVKKEGMIDYLTIDAVNNGATQYCNSTSMPLTEGDVLMVMDGAASSEVYVGNKGAIGSTFCKLEIQNQYIQSNFLYLIMKKHEYIFKKVNTGSTVPHANKEYINNFYICLPQNDDIRFTLQKDIILAFNIIIHNRKENKELVALRDFLLPVLMNGQIGFK